MSACLISLVMTCYNVIMVNGHRLWVSDSFAFACCHSTCLTVTFDIAINQSINQSINQFSSINMLLKGVQPDDDDDDAYKNIILLTRLKKLHPFNFCNNFVGREPILIFFCRNVTKKIFNMQYLTYLLLSGYSRKIKIHTTHMYDDCGRSGAKHFPSSNRDFWI